MTLLICFIGIFASFLALILRSMSVYRKEQENQLIQDYMFSLQSFYTMIQNRIEMTRRYRHDLAKHIQTLEIMMQRNEESDLQEYAENLKIQFQELKNEEYCQDEVISTVISIKRQQCLEKKIPFSFEIKDADYSSVRDIDMVGLLYNLLDNALEASERISAGQKRGIWIFMDRKEWEICIDVRNHIAADAKMDFKSKKQNKEEHGVGMKIIDYLVHKYHGEKRIRVDKEECIVSINIRLDVG